MSAAALPQALPPLAFHAHWPDRLNPEFKSLCSKVAQVFWRIISIILFPIILMEWAAKFLRQLIFSMAILPGSKSLQPVLLRCLASHKFEAFQAQKITLTAPDDIKLDGVFFPNHLKDKAIIYGFGNGEQWESVHPDRISLLLSTGANLLLVNPRTVGQSEHASPNEEGLSLDIWSAYDFLIREKGIDPNNILAIGNSMGGAITSLGAALAQEQYPDKKIKAINIRSFFKLSKEVWEILDRNISKDAYCGLSRFFPCLASNFIRLIGGELDSAVAFQKLKGEKSIFWVKSDDVIPYPAQMHAVLGKSVDSVEMRADLSDPHNRDFTDTEAMALLERIKHMLGIAIDQRQSLSQFTNF